MRTRQGRRLRLLRITHPLRRSSLSYRNYINLDNIVLDKPIYRILPIGRFIQLLTTKSLTLVKPHKWDDPFENLLLSSGLKFGRESIPISDRVSVYAQCWTWHRETDAMWRIYSANKDGVRLRSTPRKLLTALKSANPASSKPRCFIGEVEYIFKKRLNDYRLSPVGFRMWFSRY